MWTSPIFSNENTNYSSNNIYKFDTLALNKIDLKINYNENQIDSILDSQIIQNKINSNDREIIKKIILTLIIKKNENPNSIILKLQKAQGLAYDWIFSRATLPRKTRENNKHGHKNAGQRYRH